jgi:hypothetical protein
MPNSPIPGDLICNGGFEQYDPILNIPSTTSAPFAPLIPDINGESDIYNWKRMGQSTPDAFVRNGFYGIPPAFGSLVSINTWNTTGNNAMIGLTTDNDGIVKKEKVQTRLNSPLSDNTVYEFSGWFYTLDFMNPSGTSGNNMSINFKSSTISVVNYNNIPIQTLPSHNNVVGNGGWQYFSFTFTTPVGLPNNLYDLLEIEMSSTWPPYSGNHIVYTLADDISLVAVCQGSDFPQSISLTPKTGTLQPGTYFDLKIGNPHTVTTPTPFVLENHHHSERFIETDAQGNTYVAAYVNYDAGNPFVQTLMHPDITYSGSPNQVRNLPSWSGILLSKYNNCGELEWQESIFNKHHTHLAGMTISPNGDIYVLGNAESNGQIWQFLQTSSGGASSNSTTPGKRVFVAEFNTNGLCTDIVEAAVSNNRHAVDIEYYNGDFKVITTNSNTNSIEVLENDPLNNVLAPAFLITNRTALKSTVNANGELYIATAALNAIDIKRVNFNTGATISTSALITQDASRPSFGFPTQSVNDILCDNNGNVFLLGNFSNGLNFNGGTPANTFTSVYQDYANTGVGVTGFITKYTAGLGYVKSDFLAPEVHPAQMIQISDPNNPPTYSCTPPAAGTCDAVNTFQDPTCVPGGIGYACITLIWSNQGPYTNAGMFGSIYQDLSIDASNNVLVSGIVSDAQWGTGQLIQTNAQPFVCKYDNNLNRAWFNETQGAVGIENAIIGHTTGIAYEPVNGQHRVVGNFIGTVKLFDNSTLNLSGNHEHIFVTNLIDNGGSAIFKNEGDMNDAVNEVAAFTVYPNPANTMVTIEGTEAGFDYVLSNSFGQVIQTGHTASNVTEVEVSDLSAGVYMISLQGSKNETIRLVITR